MSNNKRWVYMATFKQEAVQLAKTSGKTMAEFERDLGLSKGLLKHWVRQAETDGIAAFPGHGRLPPVEGLRRLRRENEILRQERTVIWFWAKKKMSQRPTPLPHFSRIFNRLQSGTRAETTGIDRDLVYLEWPTYPGIWLISFCHN